MGKTRSITQRQLAQQVGYGQQMISMIFHGHRTPIYPKAILLSEITGIPIDTWMSSRNYGVKDIIREGWNVYRTRATERSKVDN